MRPGRARPGCSIQGTGPMFEELTSMRPGRARPGCRSSMYVTVWGNYHFNEAGARAPRMPHAWDDDRRARYRLQ